MTAKQAKEKALSVNDKNNASQYAKIMLMISDAARKGEYHIFFYDYIKPDVREELKNEGYDVGQQQSHMNEIETKISWS